MKSKQIRGNPHAIGKVMVIPLITVKPDRSCRFGALVVALCNT
ncbi:hypothetical protein [Pseudoalteromonas piscicida]|nr:hypothetical protein [Pseudoalteromonas piscicida]